jgi:hypothetical protein
LSRIFHRPCYSYSIPVFPIELEEVKYLGLWSDAEQLQLTISNLPWGSSGNVLHIG